MKFSRNIALTLICIILGIMLSWQFKSINYNQVQAKVQNKRTEDIMRELIEQQKQNSDLRKRLEELQEDNKKLENFRDGGNEQVQYYQKLLRDARMFGGLIAVKGQGIIVTLANSDISNVGERDILDVVNELRAAGAQAISVNEERIVAMSEIREAGGYIMINGTPMEAPFVIKAISSPEKLERSLTLIGGIVESIERWGVDISYKKSDDIVIPAVKDDGSVIKTDLLMPVEK